MFKGIFNLRRIKNQVNNPIVYGDLIIEGAKREHQSVPKELTSIPSIGVKTNFIGRRRDIRRIRRLFRGSGGTVFLSGIGGIGKTTIAKAYVSKYYRSYKHIVWLEQTKELENDIIGKKDLFQNLGLDNSNNTNPKSLVSELFRVLGQLDGSSLFVFDNVDEDILKLIEELPKNGWHYLITTRLNFGKEYNVYNVGSLANTGAAKLFRLHYKYKKIKNNELIDLLKLLEFHTLSLELVAKIANRRRLSIAEIQAELQETGYESIGSTNVRTSHSRLQQIDNVNLYLTKMFENDQISVEEKKLLKKLSLLPAIALPFELVSFLLGIDRKQEAELIYDLCDKGWIIHDSINDTIRIHNLIKEVVALNLEIDVKEVYRLLKIIGSGLQYDYTTDHPLKSFFWISFGESILNAFPDDVDKGLSFVRGNLAYVYTLIGNFSGALKLKEKTYEHLKMLLEEDDPELVIYKANIAGAYKDLGDYTNAKLLFEESIADTIKIYGENHIDVGITELNYGLLLVELGEFEKAFNTLMHSEQVIGENHGITHPLYAVCKENLSSIFKEMGRFEDAIVSLKEALKINMDVFGENHPNTIRNNSNLGLLYLDVEQYDLAKEIFINGLKISGAQLRFVPECCWFEKDG